ncbi:MAG TPA: hypothetical protein VFQ85_12785 [Mycobacteriales bacterium]|jgi:Flp pilus assembly protein TadG|nr:hypothetical protein [Mycobacteriales bacterium]
MTRSRSRDNGSITLEAAVLAVPAIVIALVMAVFGGLVRARLDVDAAAQDAARAATRATTHGDAQRAAHDAAAATLADRSLDCTALTINTDLTDFRPGGTVSVSITCLTESSSITVPGLNTARTFRATAVAPVDRYRSVS